MRRFLAVGAGGALAAACSSLSVHARHAKGDDQYPFKCPDLPYPYDALAKKGISSETLRFHHDKHHAGYVAKLNDILKDRSELQPAKIDDLIMTQKGTIFNLAAQVWNHTFYWHSMAPSGGGQPEGALRAAILWKWGTFDAFKKEFDDCAGGHFGSGWAWLVADKDCKLEIMATHDAQNPMTEGKTPLLTCDVWEHAYYIDYRHDRAAYLKSWWQVVNWASAARKLADLQTMQAQDTLASVVEKVGQTIELQ